MDSISDSNAVQNFWKALQIYITKPHVVNKRLSGVVHMGCAVPTEDCCVSSLRAAKSIDLDGIAVAVQEEDCNTIVRSLSDLPPKHDRLLLINKLLSKNVKIYSNCYEFVLLDYRKCSVDFICIHETAEPPKMHCSAADPPFRIDFIENHITIHPDEANASNAKWLETVLTPKLRNWSAPVNEDSRHRSIESNSLLSSQEAYIQLYNELKLKYGAEMVAKWPEQTDPAKFVYEDVAIATYLLLLWRQERAELKTEALQSFVDLGCGNGLLVFLLSSEGHQGYGIDLRKRGIWDIYPESTKLKIEAIVPSDNNLYPDIDWIIGNHSDELSPWIPVIAARSAPTTRFFVLPCCAYEFSGAKFQRRNASDSQYNNFIDYVRQISNVCGFDTQLDRLKIPSTKRICLVGLQRRGDVDGATGFDENCQRIQRFINGETKSDCVNPLDAWSTGFEPRASVEPVRNCSKLDRSIQSDIVGTVVAHLLQKRRYLENSKWNIGGQSPIIELVRLIHADQLRELKSECGGLQTLLKNHNQIFLVRKGLVQIRVPVARKDRIVPPVKPKNVRENTRKCWFLENHPDGCPFSSNECCYLH